MCMQNARMTMYATIQSALTGIRGSFSYERPYQWFSTFVFSLLVGESAGGIQSVCNSMGFGEATYYGLDRMFHSDAINLPELRRQWLDVVVSQTNPVKYYGRYLIIADGVKQPKDGRRMPGVGRLHNNSDTQSKPTSYHGIQGGAIGILVQGPSGCANDGEVYCVPLSMELMYGLGPIASWPGTSHPNATMTLEAQMLLRQEDYIRRLGSCLLIEDRASMNQNLFSDLEKLRNAEKDKLDVYLLTNAKGNVKAYELPGEYSGRGRPRVKGEKVKLADWFVDRADEFKYHRVWAYGKKVKIKYLSDILLWGDEWKGKLQFILAEMKDGRRIILATDDLKMSPAKAVELYARRFLCEEGFRSYKGDFHGMDYHFWTKSMEHLSHFRSKDLPHILDSAKTPAERKAILSSIKAAEVYMQGACIAQGIAQLISMDTPVGGEVQRYTKKRTHTHRKVSERDVLRYLHGHKDILFAKYAGDQLIEFIREKQVGHPDNAWNII